MFVPLTPLRFLHRAVDLHGAKIGVVCGDRQFTYAQFGERCERLATALPKFGVAAGDRVAYLSFNTHQLLEGYYGVVQARGIIMPLNVRLSEQELTAILNHSGAKMLMFETDFAPIIEKLRKSCRAVERWIGLDGEYESLLAMGQPERADIFSYDEMAIAELFYTSGSTGTPKGVMLAHRTLYMHALDIGCVYTDIETTVDLHTIPMFHANGWGRPQSSTMYGIKQVMVRRFEPAFVFRMIQEHRATDMCVVPTMANALINAPDLAQWDLTSLRRVTIGGAASSPELVERVEKAFPSCECVAGYGLTETSPVVTSSRSKGLVYPSESERLRRQAMAGWPVPGADVRVVDPDMRDVPRDMKTIGEVVVMGDHVMDGYYKEPEATKSVMSGVWFHTGDMAVWDEENYIHIVDRKKEIIISGGENISSIEVERAIFSHPAVFECAVVAAPDERWGEVPAAIVVLKPGARLTSEELLEFLEQHLGKFKLPRVIEFSTEPLPKTGTGKIRKMLLKERFWQVKKSAFKADVFRFHRPDLLADLYEAGTLGIIEHDGWLEAFFEDREVAARFGDPRPADATDWVQHTYDAWPPLLVGEKFFLAAPWRTEPTPPGRIRLEINPGLQCGTGQHPCTRLCLEAMERIVRPGDRVLDVGSGSGILSVAAGLLGAGCVVACDIDPDASKVVPFFVGSVDAVRSGSFDVVVANINEDVLGPMRAELERVAPLRILSGFQDDAGEWTCVVC